PRRLLHATKAFATILEHLSFGPHDAEDSTEPASEKQVPFRRPDGTPAKRSSQVSRPGPRETRSAGIREQLTVAYLQVAGSRVGSSTAQRCPAIVIRRGRRTVGGAATALASAIDASASSTGARTNRSPTPRHYRARSRMQI